MKMREIKTHKKTSDKYVGEPKSLSDGKALVSLETTQEMVVDEKGLIHGGFIFGLADYAAMLAVNEETVVLGSSEANFLDPVKLGDNLTARAEVKNDDKDLYNVKCIVKVEESDKKVFNGMFECHVLDQHVLD